MKKSLTSREIILIAILAVLVVVGAYYLLWYAPMTSRLAALQAEESTLKTQEVAAKVQQASLKRMQEELAELKKSGIQRSTIPTYDNLKPVMNELNRILEGTEDFSLAFGTVDSSQDIVKRQVELSYTCASYSQAKEVLQQLQHNPYRCVIKNLSMALDGSANVTSGGSESGKVTVSATLLFFEFKN